MAARRGPHVISLHDSAPALLGRAPQHQQPGADHRAESPHGALLPIPRGGPAPHPAVAALEERIISRDVDIQDLLVDNQRFAATHVALQQQLISAQHELRAVSLAGNKARCEREDEVCAIAGQAARIEAEALAIAAARAEVDQVHADVRVLAGSRTELMERVRVLREQVGRAQSEAAKAENVRMQIETMRREIQKGRAAVEFEKKAHADNLQQSKAMEKNMIAVASEIEKLRGDLVNAEKRSTAVTTAPAVANPGYAAPYGSTDATYGTAYGNPEAAYAATYGSAEATYAATYVNSDAYSTNQAHARTDGNPHYMAQPVHYAQYDGQQQQQQQQHTNVQR
ncbi:protein FLX-like 1 [Lolium rigidum]|uniref:protein FLX-like 1 n=1 Tax=Lolium rigidum TaxID=89674 RepID=UPI001F5CCE9C|nr:protein FLX-like 1 [Lolium rigidum]